MFPGFVVITRSVPPFSSTAAYYRAQLGPWGLKMKRLPCSSRLCCYHASRCDDRNSINIIAAIRAVRKSRCCPREIHTNGGGLFFLGTMRTQGCLHVPLPALHLTGVMKIAWRLAYHNNGRRVMPAGMTRAASVTPDLHQSPFPAFIEAVVLGVLGSLL